jgi:Flp pilus assembly secretin CpaC
MAVLGTPALAIDHTRSRPGSDLRAGIAQDAPSPERGQAERGRLFVTVDRAKIIRLPEATKTVIIGNPAIADVAIQKAGVVVMTGKSYGETNLIALDGTGNMLAESTLSVQAPSEAIVVVQRGLERQSYSCTPACQPSVILGDANSYFNSTKEQAVQHGQFSGGR